MKRILIYGLVVLVGLSILSGCSKLEKRESHYPNGQLSESGYVYKDKDENYKRTGKWTEWYENGQKKDECEYKDGKLNGSMVKWYKTGQKEAESEYKDGKFNGKWVMWFKNGQKEAEGVDKDGKPNGKKVTWFENGQKEGEGEYKDGKLNGQVILWYENGQKIGENEFKDDKQIGLPQYGSSPYTEEQRDIGQGTAEERETPFDIRMLKINPAQYIGAEVLIEGIVMHEVRRCTESDYMHTVPMGKLYVALTNATVVFNDADAAAALEFNCLQRVDFKAIIQSASGGYGDDPVVLFKSF